MARFSCMSLFSLRVLMLSKLYVPQKEVDFQVLVIIVFSNISFFCSNGTSDWLPLPKSGPISVKLAMTNIGTFYVSYFLSRFACKLHLPSLNCMYITGFNDFILMSIF